MTTPPQGSLEPKKQLAIRQRYYWPALTADVAEYVRAHLSCIKCKAHTHQKKTDQRARSAQYPWETIPVDIMGPYSASSADNRFILVIVDVYSRWVEGFPRPQVTAKNVTKTLEQEILSRYGYPKVIITDNGAQFTSASFIRACRVWGCQNWISAFYHAQANPVEQKIRS